MQALSAAMAAAALLAFGVAQAADDHAANSKPVFVVLEEDARIPFSNTITGYNVAEDGSVLINAGPNRVYRAVTWQSCARDVRFENDIAIISHGGSGVDRFSTLVIDGRRCPIESLDRIERPKRDGDEAAPAAPAGS